MRLKLAAPLLSLALAAVIASPALAADATTTDVGTLDKETAAKAFPAKPPYSPYAGRNFPTRPFFGDTHLHTSFSMDAGAFGCRLGPRDAYRFAKGEEITASSGQRVKLSRPLDFLVVADHSDGMGFFPLTRRRRPRGPGRPARPQVVRHDPVRQGRRRGDRHHRQLRHREDPEGDPARARARRPTAPPGSETIKAAEEANEPGRFTAFIGYEWTSNTGGNNLHRNVIFRDDGDEGEPGRAVHHA